MTKRPNSQEIIWVFVCSESAGGAGVSPYCRCYLHPLESGSHRRNAISKILRCGSGGSIIRARVQHAVVVENFRENQGTNLRCHVSKRVFRRLFPSDHLCHWDIDLHASIQCPGNIWFVWGLFKSRTPMWKVSLDGWQWRMSRQLRCDRRCSGPDILPGKTKGKFFLKEVRVHQHNASYFWMNHSRTWHHSTRWQPWRGQWNIYCSRTPQRQTCKDTWTLWRHREHSRN